MGRYMTIHKITTDENMILECARSLRFIMKELVAKKLICLPEKKNPRRTTPTTLANQKSLACIDRHVRLSSARGEIPLKLFVKSSVDAREDQ